MTTPSGAEPVLLAGQAMVGLVRAVAAFHAAGLDGCAIVGGVAVTARLGSTHRSTLDVDAVVDETLPPPTAIEALLALPDARPDRQSDHRVYVAGTQIEILGVGLLEAGELDGVGDDDALFVASHVWALETATPLTVRAVAEETVSGTARFATPSALVAMKLHAIQTRIAAGAAKRAADAWDIYRILVDLNGDGTVGAALAAAPEPLKRLVRDAAERIPLTEATRTRSWLRQGDDVMAVVSEEDLRYVGASLVAALT